MFFSQVHHIDSAVRALNSTTPSRGEIQRLLEREMNGRGLSRHEIDAILGMLAKRDPGDVLERPDIRHYVGRRR